MTLEIFTPAHKSVMKKLWDTIGSDVIEMCGGEALQSEVIEAILESCRLEEFSKRLESRGGSHVNWESFRAQSYTLQVLCTQEVFRHKRYIFRNRGIS